MKKQTKWPLVALGFTVIAALLVHSTHVTHLMGLAIHGIENKKTTHEDAQRLVELHHHTDKQGASSLIKITGDSPMFADGRSLRLLHERRRDSHLPRSLEKLRHWWEVHSLSHHT